jgi:peptidoglycan/LPS O-acetylase OafA/YrhL
VQVSRLGYQPALDGLRAVAITAVVGAHAFGFPAGGGLGVDLFLVLSGFLITTLLLEERARNGAVSLVGFYRRRSLRLLPALAVFLGIYLTVALLFFTTSREPASAHVAGALLGILYTSNVVQATGWDLPNGVVHLWSLSAEEQFYLLWPALLLLSLIVFRGRLWPLAAVLVGGIVSVQAIQLQLLLESASSVRLAYGPDVRAGSILVGCLLAIVLFGRARPRVDARIVAVSLALFVGILFAGLERATFAGPMLVFGGACACLVVCALDQKTWIARALSARPLVGLGKISYSLYLWHLPILVWLGAHNGRLELLDGAAIGLSLAAATASYRFVELPFLRRKRGRASAERVPSGGRPVVVEGGRGSLVTLRPRPRRREATAPI